MAQRLKCESPAALSYDLFVAGFGTDYRVAGPTGVCAATGRPLDADAAYVATLCERPDGEGFDRLDYSLEAWEAGARPEGLLGSWRTTNAPAKPSDKRLIDDDVLLEIFERLADDDRQQHQAFRFVLALILMRKRRFKFAGRSRTGDVECWLMRRGGADPREPPAEVVNPGLSDDDVREVAARLGELFQSEL